MHDTTMALLALADTLPGGRERLLNDMVELISDRQFFSSESVAKRYDVSLSCVKKWREKGVLVPSLKIENGTVRYTLGDLRNFEKRWREK